MKLSNLEITKYVRNYSTDKGCVEFNESNRIMKTQTEELLKRIEQAEDELAKLKSELNKPDLPSWDELGRMYYLDLKRKNSIKTYYKVDLTDKERTFRRLLVVADHVNEKPIDYADNPTIIALDNGKLKLYSYGESFKPSPVIFKSYEAAQKARDIFKNNDSEQELIDFYK